MPAAKQARPIDAESRCPRRSRRACRGPTCRRQSHVARCAVRSISSVRGARTLGSGGCGGLSREAAAADAAGEIVRRRSAARRPTGSCSGSAAASSSGVLLGPGDRLGRRGRAPPRGGPGAGSTRGGEARCRSAPARRSGGASAIVGLELRLGRDDQRVVRLEVPRLAISVGLLALGRSSDNAPTAGRSPRTAWTARRRPPAPPSRGPPRARWAGRRRCLLAAAAVEDAPGPVRSARRSSAAAPGGPPPRAGHLADGVARRLGADDAHAPGVIARRLAGARRRRRLLGVLARSELDNPPR